MLSISKKLRALIALAGLCACAAACGVAPDEPTPTESPAFTGSAHFRGDAYCGPTAYHVVEIISQTLTRPGQWNGYVPNFYTTTVNWAPNDSVDATLDLSFNCFPSLKIPVTPTCGNLGAICSTAGSACAVYTRAPGQSVWAARGFATMWGLTYQPLAGYGTYTTALDGPGITALGCSSINFELGN